MGHKIHIAQFVLNYFPKFIWRYQESSAVRFRWTESFLLLVELKNVGKIRLLSTKSGCCKYFLYDLTSFMELQKKPRLFLQHQKFTPFFTRAKCHGQIIEQIIIILFPLQIWSCYVQWFCGLCAHWGQAGKNCKPAKKGAVILRSLPQVRRRWTTASFDLCSYPGRITMVLLSGPNDVCTVLAYCRRGFVATRASLMSFICFVLSPSTSHSPQYTE